MSGHAFEYPSADTRILDRGTAPHIEQRRRDLDVRSGSRSRLPSRTARLADYG